MHATAVQQAVARETADRGGDLVAASAGGAVVLVVVLVVLVGLLLRRYRSECHQLRARNRQLSIENDRWQDDFAVQAVELAMLRRGSGIGRRATGGGHRSHRHAEAS